MTMLPEPDLFRNTGNAGSSTGSCTGSSHDPLCPPHLNNATNIEDLDSLQSVQPFPIDDNGHSHSVATLSLPRNKLKIVSSGGRSAPVYSKIFNNRQVANSGHREERNTRRWYLIVIVLLYVGLLTSFSLNVSLLIRREPHSSSAQIASGSYQESPWANTQPNSEEELSEEDFERIIPGPPSPRGTEFAYTTACLVQDPCPAGSFYSCSLKSCLSCPLDSYQPQWGQTSCWPCPNNTHTDRPGAETAAACKQSLCGKFSRPDLAVLQTPNYPAEFPLSASCHWKVRAASHETSLIIIPHLGLPPHCTHTLTVRSLDKGGANLLETCKSSEDPILMTADASTIYVDFVGKGNATAEGFQISILSVPAELSEVVDAVLAADQDNSRKVLGYSRKEDRLMSRLISLLSPGLRRDKSRKNKNKPLIEAVEDSDIDSLQEQHVGDANRDTFLTSDTFLSSDGHHGVPSHSGPVLDPVYTEAASNHYRKVGLNSPGST